MERSRRILFLVVSCNNEMTAATPSEKAFRHLLTKCMKSGNGSGMVLSDAIKAAVDRVRDLARETGMLEYRAQRDVALNTAYHKHIAMIDSALSQLDALYALRTKVCYEDVAGQRRDMLELVKKTADFKQRVKKLHIPSYIDETKVILTCDL